MIFSENPFDDSDLLAFAPNGSLVAIVRRPMKTNAKSPAFTLTIHGASGRLRVDTVPYTPMPITDSSIEVAWLSAQPRFAQLNRRQKVWPTEAATRNAYINALPTAPHLPPVTKLLVGNDSTIWLQRASGGGSADWEVYDLHGRVLGRFQLPKTFAAVTASDHFIWGSEPDDDGEVRVARYRVGRK
jgi:hypothetical protein